MRLIAKICELEIIVIVAAFAAIVSYKLLTAQINVRGLLFEKTPTGLGGYSPIRLQLLLATVGGAVYLAGEIAANAKAGRAEFPPIPIELLAIVAGSHTLYLGSKVLTLLRDSLRG